MEKLMISLKLHQIICAIFPPILSQSIRDVIFPLEKARALALEFSKTSITGSKFYGNTSDDHSYRFAIHGFFDWRNIIIANRYVKRYGGDIIEIGANVGTETVSYCDLVTLTGKVHAFEPLPNNIQTLNKLSEQLENLIIYPKAISNTQATVKFLIPPPHESGIGKIISNEHIQDGMESLMVDTLTLDSLMDDFKDLCLISIDTEGHEPFVLEGAYKTFKKFRPSVIIEVSPKLLRKHADSTAEEIFNYFQELDYRCFTIERSSLKAVEKIDLDYQKSQNWFCVPTEKSDIIDKIQKDLLFRAYVPWYLLKPLNKKV